MEENELGPPLTRSLVGDHIWSLYETDRDAFKRAVRDYYEKTLPGFTVVKASKKERAIFLRDDRIK